jgi:pSer/pThr/pTyr-binding forkhead associated (FHA) protein
MRTVTFLVIDGVDKGLVFRDFSTPLTIGREEGNTLRLNDERVSRFHAKVQSDQGDLILTDLDSTNGTRVNGLTVAIHRLQVGDCVNVGRTTLLFGSEEQIRDRIVSYQQPSQAKSPNEDLPMAVTVVGEQLEMGHLPHLDPESQDPAQCVVNGLLLRAKDLPPLPQNLSPSQAARLTEILELLHKAINQITLYAQAIEGGARLAVHPVPWQNLLMLQLLLARYIRGVADPEVLND